LELVAKPYRFLKYRVVHNLRRAIDFRLARRSLLRSAALSDAQKLLLETVSLRTDLDDRMYAGSAAQYLSVGLSALDVVDVALRESHKMPDTVREILDFPSGHGRVLRFLQVQFPAAAITAAEVDHAALDFCRRSFAVRSRPSGEDFRRLGDLGRFDLIWCGSLITHIDERRAADLLTFFRSQLAPGGVCVVTTHGERSAEWIENGTDTYRLSAAACQFVLRQFRDTGYGYADYDGRSRYGVSLVSRSRMLEIAAGVGNWRPTCYLEHGWLDHQDVYVFAAGN
jgi:hypothetical protein